MNLVSPGQVSSKVSEVCPEAIVLPSLTIFNFARAGGFLQFLHCPPACPYNYYFILRKIDGD